MFTVYYVPYSCQCQYLTFTPVVIFGHISSGPMVLCFLFHLIFYSVMLLAHMLQFYSFTSHYFNSLRISLEKCIPVIVKSFICKPKIRSFWWIWMAKGMLVGHLPIPIFTLSFPLFFLFWPLLLLDALFI